MVAAAALVTAAAAPASSVDPFHNGDGIRVLSVRTIDARLLALTVATRALPAPPHIRILLPTGYATRPRQRYPVLYLLHGTSGGAADWTTMGDAEQTTSGKPLIVVMPDIALGGDGGGWCTNWWRKTAAGRPQWETFHIDELIPWVDANLRTIPSRAGRAIAGLSQGGFCAMSYAARHPDLFGTALSFSGAPDIAWDAQARALVTPIINATELALDHVPANSMFGPRSTDELNWAAHDPATLAVNLRSTRLFLFTGNGRPGPFDTGAQAVASPIEAGVHVLTRLFHDRLDSLGIASHYDDYGPGTHSWPYWARDLRESIEPIMSSLDHPAPAPSSITFTTTQQSYAIDGWIVAIHRQVDEFSTLERADRAGFVVLGSGSATVTTPAVYRPGSGFVVTEISSGGTSGPTTTRARVGADGRLTVALTLGPSNTVQEFRPGARTTVDTVRVELRSS